jgi:hypothetical protein
MPRSAALSQRPEWFELDRQHPLHKGLVFAGLGGGRGSLRYLDASGYGNHGTLTNMDPASDWVWVSQLNRFALDFDGSNDIVPLQVDPIKTSDYTFSCWAYRRTFGLNSLGRFFDNGKVLIWVYSSRGDVVRASNDGGSTAPESSALFTANAWHHICVTRSGTTCAFTINGVSAGSGSGGTVATGTTVGNIGNNAASTRTWDGLFGDVAIWNRILSPAEIQQLADPSNVMLSGLLLPPRRRLWAVSGGAPPAGFKAAWAARNRRIIGGGVI